MALKITSVTVDPSDAYTSCEAFHDDYIDVALDPLEPGRPAVLVGWDRQDRTAAVVATHGVWPEESASEDCQRLSVYEVKFTGVTEIDIPRMYDLASFAVLDREHGYNPADWSKDLVAVYGQATNEDGVSMSLG